jgi:hypothetical protein
MHVGFLRPDASGTLAIKQGGAMPIRRFLWLPVLLFVALATNLAAAEFTCPVTTPSNPPFVPPAPYEVNAGEARFWYGTNDLWTQLPANGAERGLPYTEGEGYSNKLGLWKQGYDGTKEPQPDIIVVVKRLDITMPLTSSRGGTNAFFDGTWAMLTGVTYPTAGCWEVTSYHGGHTLTFVVSVQP